MSSGSDLVYVNITVDVEGLRGQDPLKHLIHGDLPSGFYGIRRIMEICDKHGVRATFFVDVYEAVRCGEGAMAGVCREIHNRGHDVQLHAHPDQAYDQARRHVARYSLQEQRDMIRTGLEWIEKWTGKRPIAFRAGGYGANADTLQALQDNGIFVDASMFYRRRECELNGVVDTRNKVVKIGSVLELPTTVYQTFRLGRFSRFEKLDIDGCSLRELKWAFHALPAQGVNYIVLFLHSHSFVRWNREMNHFSADLQDVEKFDHILGHLTRQDRFRFITVEDAAHMRSELLASGSDRVPFYGNRPEVWRRTFKRAWGAVRTSRRALAFVVLSLMLLAGAAVGGVAMVSLIVRWVGLYG